MKTCNDRCTYYNEGYGNSSWCDVSGLKVVEGMACLEEKKKNKKSSSFDKASGQGLSNIKKK